MAVDKKQGKDTLYFLNSTLFTRILSSICTQKPLWMTPKRQMEQIFRIFYLNRTAAPSYTPSAPALAITASPSERPDSMTVFAGDA